jgi:glycerol-3-phosphate O-acyltransferase / dihydroxyacetone phosphate acyltransferase
MSMNKEGERVQVLRFKEMLILQKGSLVRRLIHAIIATALRLFFRRIETSNVQLVPPSGPVVFVLNHPNGLIDPALVFCALPRRVSFLAKSTLFHMPVLGSLMRIVEALPLYRRVDTGEDSSKNLKTFEACHQLLRQGRCIALFPEGFSHSATHLQPIKTGAARIALGALSIGSDNSLPSLLIMPVGLYYTSKTSFRSEALIRFGLPMEVFPIKLDENGEPPRDEVLELSERIGESLTSVTLNVEDDIALSDVTKAQQLFSSFYETIDIRRSLTDAFSLLRRLAEKRRFYNLRSPKQITMLKERIERYEKELDSIGIRPQNLSLTSHTRWQVIIHFLTRTLLLLIALPFTLIGTLIHLPAYISCSILAKLFGKHGVDDIAPTVKILAAILFMPLTWLLVSISIYFLLGWRLALLAFPSSIVCGYIALRSIEEFQDMKGWYRAVLLLLRRRGLFLRLLLERNLLHDEINRIASDGG